MKKEIKYCMVMAAAAMAFTACSSEETVDNSGPVEARVTAGVSGPQTRAVDDVWEQDEIGVMVTGVTETTEGVESQMKTLYQNVKYTTTATSAEGAAFTSTDGIYFQDANETVTFAAYGPYKTSDNKATLPGTDGNGVVTGSTSSQSTRESQKDFDYIYASGATASQSNPAVNFSDEHAFQHKMTRLIIIVKTGDGFTASDVAGSGNVYSLKGLNHSGQFDVVKGVAEATTGTATTTDEYWSLTKNSLLDNETNPVQYTFTSILYPQKDANLIFKANIDSQEYTTPSGKIAPELKAGYSYTYTVTVNKTEVTVSGCTVKEWSVGTGDDNASATM